MARDPGLAYDIGQSMLGALQDRYDAEGVSLPSRQFVSAQNPVYDFEQVSVFMAQTGNHEGDVAAELLQPFTAAAGFGLRQGTWQVCIVRCAPVPGKDGKTSVDAENAVAALILADEVLMMDALIQAQKAGGLAGCNLVAFMGWQTIPSGDLVGGVLTVRVGLQSG